MEKAYIVQLMLGTQAAGSYPSTVKIFTSEGAAKECCQQLAAMLGAAWKAKLVVTTPQGPQVLGTMGELLVELGIVNMGVNVYHGPIHQSQLVEPPGPQIVLAKN